MVLLMSLPTHPWEGSMYSVYFAVLARDEDVVKRYLYSHSEVIAVAPSTREGVQAIMVATTVTTTEDEALSLANYQRGRLESGLYPATEAYLSMESVEAALVERGWREAVQS